MKIKFFTERDYYYLKFFSFLYIKKYFIYLLETKRVDRDSNISIKDIKKLLYKKNKFKIVYSNEEEAISWASNQNCIDKCQKNYEYMLSNTNKYFYLGNFLATKSNLRYAYKDYLKTIKKKLNIEKTKFSTVLSLSRILNYISSSFLFYPFWLILLIIISVKVLFQNISLSINRVEKTNKNICYDMRFAKLPSKKNYEKKDGITDGFLIDKTDFFSLENSLFFDIKNTLKKNDLLKLVEENNQVELAGAKLNKIKINFISITKILINNILDFSDAFFFCPQPKEGWHFHERLEIVSFFHKVFQVELSLYNYNLHSYISFLDYDPLHHAIGYICKRKNTIFFGIAHSSLHDQAYYPSPSFVSFDHYLIVSEFHKKIHPSWKNKVTNLHCIGPWKSDFTYNYLKNDHFSKKIESIKKSLQNYFVVSLHLPPVGTFVFSEKEIKKWLNIFLELINENKKLFFILHSRRDNNLPQYYKDFLEEIQLTKRSLISNKLESGFDEFYYWPTINDLVISCGCSDTLIESWAFNIPATCYPGFGKNKNSLETFGNGICVYSKTELKNVILETINKQWPTKAIIKSLSEFGLYGNGDGQRINKMKDIILKSTIKLSVNSEK